MKNNIFILLFLLSIYCSKAQTPPNLGVAINYGLLSADSILSSDTSFVRGNSGAVSFISSKVQSDSNHINTSRTTSALNSLASAKVFLSGQTGTTISNVLDGQSKSAGVYNISGDALLDGELILNGDTNSIFIFNISGNLIIDSSVIYGLDDIRSSNIYWNVSGYVVINTMNSFFGTILSTGRIYINGNVFGNLSLLSQSDIIINNNYTTTLRGIYSASRFYAGNNKYKNSNLKHLFECDIVDLSCNLFTNHSFETVEINPGSGGNGGLPMCPQDLGQINFACDWDNVYYLPVWPYTDSPDLFSNCEDQFGWPTGIANTPYNIYNEISGPGQPPHTGDNYAGFAYSNQTTADPQDDIPPFNSITWTNDEKLEKHLYAPLVPNKKYYMEFYTSLAEKSNRTAKIAVYPATAQFFGSTPIPPVYQASPFFITPTNVTTNTAWNKVSGCVSTTRNDIDVIGIKTYLPGGIAANTTTDPSFYTSSGIGGLHWLAYFYIDDVTLRPIADAGNDFTYNCAGANFIGVNCSPIVGASYTWTAGNSLASTSAIISSPNSLYSGITCLTSGTYIFTLTTTYAGCTDTDQITVVSTSGNCSAVTIISVSNNNTNYTTGTTIINPTSVAIYDNVTVQSGATLTFTNTDVRIYTGKSINVKPGGVLNIDGAWLHSCATCNGMWEGITVEPGGTVNIIGGSLIEDANKAVNSVNTSGASIPNINISGAIFNKNTIGLNLQSNPNNMNTTFVKNTVFTCRSLPAPTLGNFSTYFGTIKNALIVNTTSSLAPYPRTTTLANLRSKSGIETNGINYANNSLKIGDPTFSFANVYLNVFDNLDYGAFISNSNINFRNTTFQNMTGIQPFCIGCLNYPTGVGVFSPTQTLYSTNTLSIGGTVNILDKCSFIDCFRGIEINNYWKVDCYKNIFNCTTTPTVVSNTTPSVGSNAIFLKNIKEDVELHQNTITNIITGVLLSRNTATGGTLNPRIEFNGNTINANTSGYCTQAMLVTDISNNTITTAQQIYIRHNTQLDFVNNGIKLTNIKNGPIVYDNIIKLRYNSNTLTYAGVWMEGCDKAEVKNNDIHTELTTFGTNNWNVRGLYAKTSTNNKVYCNTLYSLGQCMVFEGNCSSPTANGYGIRSNNMDNSRTGLMLRNTGIIGTQGNSTTPNGNTWNNSFTFDQGRTYTFSTANANTASVLYCNAGGATFPPLGTNSTNSGLAAEYSIISGGLITATGSPITCPSTEIPAGIMAKNDDQKSSNILDLQYIHELIQLLTNADNEQEYLIKQYIYSEISKEPLLRNDSLLDSFYINHENASVGMLYSVDRAIENKDYATAIATNNAVLVSNNVEQNQKSFNTIYLQHLDSIGSYTQNDLDALYAIAWQCAIGGGNAVYQSRNLLMAIENRVIDFTENCDAITFQNLRGVGQGVELSNFRLYPNPNNGNMIVEYSLAENETGVINLFSITGTLLHSYPLQQASHKLLIENEELKSGIYLYDVIINDKKVKTDKVVIIK